MHMIAFYKQEREEWRRTSMLSFNIGRFGNSDPKKFPGSLEKYMPELWIDENKKEENDLLLRAAKMTPEEVFEMNRKKKSSNG